eukprot:CAMPEP_0174876150 /NCGR_PEP_ID=MMETSP1114-20130205/79601_1 /TAXON_ID=312471 /ORGANISM="Neobodo designis, Strain CCAP 1951/1" /LENGTH=124 /DNA_ID=CAMNT_0016111511 /DNA_START=8 /DNA_END=378 /DNA_ORIENTATION=+
MDSNVNDRQHNAANAPAIRVGGLPTMGAPGAATSAPTSSVLSPRFDESCHHHHPHSFISPTPQHRRHGPAVRMAAAAACGGHSQTPSPNAIDLPPSVHAAIGNLGPTDPSHPAPPAAARHGNSR